MSSNSTVSFVQYLYAAPKAALSVVVWVLGAAVIIIGVIYLQMSRNERSFIDQATHAYDAVHEKISINETVLEGFASMLRLSGDSPTIRQYTAEMRHAYPHIYSVGFQQFVPANNLKSFEQKQREKGYTNFGITDFSYESDREFYDAPKARSYYPTLFGESVNPDVQIVIGLDQFSVPFLKDALLMSIRTGNAVATKPFTFAEGGRGYVLYKSLRSIPDFDPDKTKMDSMAVSMAIKMDVLLSFASEVMPHATAQLFFKDQVGEDVAETILASVPPAYFFWFSTLRFERQLDEVGQPFSIVLTGVNGLTVWNLVFLCALFLLSIILGILFFQNSYRRYLSVLSRDHALSALSVERQGLEARVTERTEQLNQKTDEIRHLANKLVNLQEEDYRYIAREMHDEFGQLITAIGINTKLVADRTSEDPSANQLTSETKTLIDQLYTSMHSLIGRLRPETLDTFGLAISLEQCLALFRLDELGIECKVDIDRAVDQLPDNYAISIYRAIQELVNNAVKHGEPDCIGISIQLVRESVQIDVVDNGCGMNAGDRFEGYGLSGLNERVIALSGSMLIDSSVGNGCSIHIVLPLQRDEL